MGSFSQRVHALIYFWFMLISNRLLTNWPRSSTSLLMILLESWSVEWPMDRSHHLIGTVVPTSKPRTTKTPSLRLAPLPLQPYSSLLWRRIPIRSLKMWADAHCHEMSQVDAMTNCGNSDGLWILPWDFNLLCPWNSQAVHCCRVHKAHVLFLWKLTDDLW